MKWGVWMISGSLTPWIMLCSPQNHPPQFGNTGSSFFFNYFVSMYFFIVELTSNFAEKAEKGTCHWVLHWKHIIQQKSCEDDKQVHDCMWWWHWVCPGQWSVTALEPSEVRGQTVRDKCAGNILSLSTGYSPWQAAPETLHTVWVFLETTRFRHPLNVLHINQMWQTVFFCFMYIHIDIYVYMYISFCII